MNFNPQSIKPLKLTRPEYRFAELLNEIGYKPKPSVHSEEFDPSTVVYMQYKVDRWVLDFAFPHAKIGFEIDGEYWHGHTGSINAQQAIRVVRDKEKAEFLEQLGWKVIRITDKEVKRLSSSKLQCIIWGLLDV